MPIDGQKLFRELKKLTVLSVDKDVEQPDFSYIVEGNINHQNHFGDQFGSFFKS